MSRPISPDHYYIITSRFWKCEDMTVYGMSNETRNFTFVHRQCRVKYFEKEGINDSRDKLKYLLFLTLYGEQEKLKEILTNELFSKHEKDLLELCIKKDLIDMIKFFHDNYTIKSINSDTLIMAASWGHYRMLLYLIQISNISPKDMRKVITASPYNGNMDVLKYLVSLFSVSKFTDTYYRMYIGDSSPLTDIIESGNIDMTLYILDRINTDRTSWDSLNILLSAAQSGSLEITKMLIGRYEFNKGEIIKASIRASSKGYSDIFCLLYNLGNLKIDDIRGKKDVNIAIVLLYNGIEVIKFLRDKGLTNEEIVKICNEKKFGETVIYRIANDGHLKMLKFLYEDVGVGDSYTFCHLGKHPLKFYYTMKDIVEMVNAGKE